MDAQSLATYDDRRRALSALRNHGWNATSFQVLGTAFSYWFAPDGAFVAYVDTGSAWVVAGAPVCATGALTEAARKFAAEAARHGRDAVFFATESRAAGMPGFRSLKVGEQPVWDPQAWSSVLRSSADLRRQLRRAKRHGVEIIRLEPEAVQDERRPLRHALNALMDGWLASRRLPPLGFLVEVEPFSFAEERRLFLAVQGGRAVGFANVVPVYARGGWFVQDLIRCADAPQGTVEALVDAAMLDAAELGSEYLTLGLAPLAGDVATPLRLVARCTSRYYDFGGLHAFKAKLRPDAWVPIFVTHPEPQSSCSAILHSLRAFARGSLLGYGASALLGGKVA